MEAYGELVKSVSRSLNGFVTDVVEAGAECLDGLCSARAWANAGAASSQQHDAGASAAQPESEGEP